MRDTERMDGDRADFFVSHAGADRAWAEWVAWQLEQAGYRVVLDVWDFPTGANFVTEMNAALERCDKVVALCSAAYFDRSRYTTEEWSAAVLHVPDVPGRLIPVRIEDIADEATPAVLRSLIYKDLFGLDAARAREELLAAVRGPVRPPSEPPFPDPPGASGRSLALVRAAPRLPLPGRMPAVWNVPPRNQQFTGRDGLLVAVRERLLRTEAAVVQALAGAGGVGKTQLAIEYAHRFADAYDLIWWVDAEQPALIGAQFAALGAALGSVPAGADSLVVRTAVLGHLRRRERWLLVFDNAQQAADVAPWLPGGDAGHMLITSRVTGWHEIAGPPVEVDVFARPESVAILLRRVPGFDAADADMLADDLGDLPLAVAQAVGYMAESGMPAKKYRELLCDRAAEILRGGRPSSYPSTLVAATELAFERLGHADPAAADLARIAAFLAPEPIALTLFTAAADRLPEPLASAAADALAWRGALAALNRSALARAGAESLRMHRLIQAILRAQPQAVDMAELTRLILAASDPGDPGDPATWPSWATLLPHILATSPADTADPAARNQSCRAVAYLTARGDATVAAELADDLYQGWTKRLGASDSHALTAGTHLARARRHQGHYPKARQLDQDILMIRRDLLGMDHPDTLVSAHHLASDLWYLGDYQAARELDEDTLARRRQVLGLDHPDTLTSANNFARDLWSLGDYRAARELDEDTLARRRQVLGMEHPDTLASANNLARDLWSLGENRAAWELAKDMLVRRRQVLGLDHPDTLVSASILAIFLWSAGERQAARELAEDTLARFRRLLAPGHAAALVSASPFLRWSSASPFRQWWRKVYLTARDLAEDILARMRRVLGPDHPDTQATERLLARILVDMGSDQPDRES
jgi:TIR domain/Tetratricopeptide repeat